VAWSDRAAEEETGTGARSGDGGGVDEDRGTVVELTDEHRDSP
jgi:hypothetical protein